MAKREQIGLNMRKDYDTEFDRFLRHNKIKDQECARIMGTNRATVSNYRKDPDLIKAGHIAAFCDYYGIHLPWFFECVILERGVRPDPKLTFEGKDWDLDVVKEMQQTLESNNNNNHEDRTTN